MSAATTSTSNRCSSHSPTTRNSRTIIRNVTAGKPEYDFVAPDGFGHTLWVIDDEATISKITEEFEKIRLSI